MTRLRLELTRFDGHAAPYVHRPRCPRSPFAGSGTGSREAAAT